jgi:cytochrome c553
MKILRVSVSILLCSLLCVAQAAGDPEAGKQKSAVCAGCHGVDGNSSNPEWPKLSGQGEAYLFKQLLDFNSKDRENALMNAQVANLSEQDMHDLAAYYASQKPTPGSTPPEFVELGQQVYRGGNIGTGLPACMGCHSPTGAGNPRAVFPRLSGQHSKYVENQLRGYRDRLRANDPQGMMRKVAQRMTVEELQAVAQYVAGLH